MIEKILTDLHIFLAPSPKNDNKFVLFADGRSGSDLLRNLLNSHSQIYCDSEILDSRIFFTYLFISRKKQSIINTGKVYGFKAKLHQIVTQKQSPKLFLSSLIKDNWKIIYLRRNNLLKQAISLLIALNRNKWHDRLNEPRENTKIFINCSDLLSTIQGLDRSRKKEKSILKDLPHIKIIYEDDLLNAENHQATLDKIFNYLEVDHESVTTNLVRTTSDQLSDIIENYDEVVNFIRQTEYAKFLDD